MKRLLSFILICFLITACKKGKADFTLKGAITDQSFNTGLAGATVKLYEVEAGGGATNLLGTQTITDGNYSFTFPRNKVESYQLVVTKANYFELNETIFFSELTIKEDNTKDYSIWAKSWVNLVFINSNPQPGDQLQYNRSLGKKDCDECCSAETQLLTGAIDTVITCINDGNTIYAYNYWLLGMGINGTKSITTPPFDTVDLVLTY